MADSIKTTRATREGGRENLRKVSISRIKKEMSDVFYLSDDLVITTLDAQNNTTSDYPASIDGFSAIIMMTGEATVSIDMQNYNVKPNTIVFFNPDSIIRTVKCSSNAAAYFLAFSKSFVNEIQIDLSTSLPVYMRFGKAPVLEVTPQDVDQIRQLFQLIKTMLRSDKERSLPVEERENLEEMLRSKGIAFGYTDMYSGQKVTKQSREMQVREKMEELASARLVITDRLHGMVFCALAGTPCIAMSSSNHKVRGTYEWISYLPYVRYAKTPEEVERYLPELLAMENCRYDNAPLRPWFDKLAEVVRKDAHN